MRRRSDIPPSKYQACRVPGCSDECAPAPDDFPGLDNLCKVHLKKVYKSTKLAASQVKEYNRQFTRRLKADGEYAGAS